MFAATIVISALDAHWVRNILLEKSEEYDSLLVENLNHQIFLRFVVPAAFKYKEIKLRDEEQSKWLDQVIRSTLHSFHVENVNIYGVNNVILYSFDKQKIGLKNAGGVSYEKAIEKELTSRLVRTGNFWELLFWFPKETKIVTFAPLHAEKRTTSSLAGPVLGVLEIVRDVTEDYKKIFKLQVLIVVSCFGVMGILFLVLRFVVKQGETIIERRAEERLRLEEKLRQAEHLSTIGEMTAGVSHEIRNPLGIIKSSSELLKNKMIRLEADPTIAEIIIEESQRLDSIIKDFLDFARPKNPDFYPCRLDEVIEKNLTFLATQIEAHKIEIVKKYESPVSEISGDSAMLYQAFLNIFINAFQAMSDGGCLTIHLKQESDFLALHFLDEGEGILEKELKKIWSPFFTTKDTGTGLGLGIVKNIIEAHNGTIDISNRAVRGVDVRIALPVRGR
ncbi:MAG: two-component sensor histidine kinase [Desulfobacteraceae bacterium]|nr:MAG: two-component sensor histidine kinase [Desulfobacteraceae bacterium]